MYVFKCFINYSKEEKWLAEMAKKGYELVNACFGYTFKKITPEEAIYRIDYRQFKTKADFIDYCTLFEDSGWKHIVGSKSSGTQYFKKLKPDSDNDIFSDNMSKAGRYKRVSRMWGTLTAVYIPITIATITTNSIGYKAFLNPKLLYYTPGLWEKTGIKFIGSFLFETPFALMRILPLLLFPIMIFLSILFAYKAGKLAKETMKSM